MEKKTLFTILITITITFSVYFIIDNFIISINKTEIGVSDVDISQSGDYSSQLVNIGGTIVIDKDVGDKNSYIHQEIVDKFACTYEINDDNRVSYNCGFSNFIVKTDSSFSNVLFELPNGEKAFVTSIQANVPLPLANCFRDHSNCFVFNSYKYSKDNKPCYIFTLENWGGTKFTQIKEVPC